jgi:hypothetical protein
MLPQKPSGKSGNPRASRKANGEKKSRARNPMIARGPVLLSTVGDPFPIRMVTKLRYGQLFTETCGASGLFGTEQVFRLNSLFDPDLTGTGHQPYGFDTLATIYYRYKVHAVSITLRFSDPSADGIICAAHFQSPDTTATVTGSDPNVIMERSGVWTRNLNNTGSQVVTLQQHFPMHQLCNLTISQFKNNIEDYQALCTTSPARTPYVRIATAALDGSSTSTCRVEAIFDFHCEFFDRIVLSQS